MLLAAGPQAPAARYLTFDLCDRPLTVEITPDDHSFRPLRTAPEVITEYAKGFSVAELFEQSVVGIQTGCDALVIDPDKAVLSQRMQAWYGLRHADTDTLSHWLTEIGLTRPSQITRMIGKLRALPEDATFDGSLIHPIQYRRDEQRWIYYSPAFLHRNRFGVQRHLLKENVGLVWSKRVLSNAPWDDVLVTHALTEVGVLAVRPSNGAPVAPLFLYEGDSRRPNFRPEILAQIEAGLGLRCVDGEPAPERHFRPVDLLDYIVGSSSPTTENRMTVLPGPPRVPMPVDGERFRTGLVPYSLKPIIFTTICPIPDCSCWHGNQQGQCCKQRRYSAHEP